MKRLVTAALALVIFVAGLAATGAPALAVTPTISAMFLDGETSGPMGDGSVLATDVTATGASDRVWLVGRTATDRFDVFFWPPTGSTLTVGVYESVTDSPTADRAGLNATSVCNGITGRFIIDELTTDSQGAPTSFAARFEMHCAFGNTDPAMFGAVAYNATTPFRSRTVTPGFLIFPSLREGRTSPPKSVTITNNGPAVLTVSSPSIIGRDANAFTLTSSTCTAPLSAGQTCTLTAAFTPPVDATVGWKAGRLRFFDEIAPAGGGGSGRDIDLSGEVLAPQWREVGGSSLSDASVAVADGIEAFNVGLDGGLWYRTLTTAGWGSQSSLGGFLTSAPAAATDANSTWVFATGGDDALWVQEQTTAGWTGWRPLGGFLLSTPTPVATPAGLFVFAVGGDFALWYQRFNGVWSGWLSLGGAVSSDVAAEVDGTGVSVFARGGDYGAWTQRLTNGTWSGWLSLGGILSSYPAAAVNSDGMHLLARGADGALWTRRRSGSGWSGWSSLGGYLRSAPAAVANDTGIAVFGVGADNAMWTGTLTPGFTGWRWLGNAIVSNPVAAFSPSLGTHVVAIQITGYKVAAYDL